ncbi:putative zinc finger protein [Kribbella amoyensis]|uniref:Putative zinc finger protein n=1 Tax=Kribbella amoyensis TaxID=996641 RepID=A0A561B0R1_9ACTN|nr:zf-HC2 domain-containing protein [Kribbella amoyensis]TWD72422.1 putative zinc finger protein [Kribbella amoyensis]
MTEHDRSQLGAYALGALEPDEAREVEQHLAGCAECRTELAELEELKAYLGEVPPEAFLDGPPPDGDLLLQRTLREVRDAETPPPVPVRKRSRWLAVAAAVVVLMSAVGGGVVVGRQSVEQVAEAPSAGARQVTATDAVTGAKMATTVEPRSGWSWIDVQINGLTAGAECKLLVTDTSGKVWTAGSWVVSEKAAQDGSRFGGGVLVPLDQVKSVEIQTLQGEHVVTTQL